MEQQFTYAIDFGTSNSLLAAATPEQVFSPIALDDHAEDSTVLRSTMYFSRGEMVRFGQNAINTYIEESAEGRFIRSIKRFLPKKSFRGTQIGNNHYGLEELIGTFLKHMKDRADQHFQTNCQSVVLGRPALFSQNAEDDALAQKRLQDAAATAGFEHISFLPEPLAAAFDYRSRLTAEKLILVVDLGGGTSDFTIIRLHPGKYSPEDVLSIGGVSVAGDALDGGIMGHRIAPHFGSQVQYKLPMSENILRMPPDLKLRLMSPAEITLMSRSDIMYFLNDVKKCSVGANDQESLENLFSLISANLGFRLFDLIESCKRQVCNSGKGTFKMEEEDIFILETITSLEFQKMINDQIGAIFSSLDNVVNMAAIKFSDIDLICCTGGTSKVPQIQTELLKRFGEGKIQTLSSFHSVIAGLAHHAKNSLS